MRNKVILYLFFIGFLFLFSNKIKAQRSLGIGASYSTELQSTAIHLKFSTAFSEKLGSAVEYENYFFSTDDKWQTVSLHFLYNIIRSEDFNFYILGGGQFFIYESEDVFVNAGGTYNGISYPTDFTLQGAKGSDIGGRLGIGLNKAFTSHLIFFAETKIAFYPKVEDLTSFSNLGTKQIIPTAGLAYQF